MIIYRAYPNKKKVISCYKEDNKLIIKTQYKNK